MLEFHYSVYLRDGHEDLRVKAHLCEQPKKYFNNKKELKVTIPSACAIRIPAAFRSDIPRKLIL
jgi:hypothetical protein